MLIIDHSRSKSLPRIAALKLDNTSPLNEIKKKRLSKNPVDIAESPKRIEEFLEKARGFDTFKEKKLKFMFPDISTTQKSTTFLKNEMNSPTEELGKKVLKLCHILRSKSPRFENFQSLRKGEGRLMGGTGLTNREMYDKIFGLTKSKINF